MACLGNGELLLLGHPVLLGYDHVRQVLDVGVELDGGVPGRAGLQHAPVVLHVVLDAVVDVGDLDQEDKDQVLLVPATTVVDKLFGQTFFRQNILQLTLPRDHGENNFCFNSAASKTVFRIRYQQCCGSKYIEFGSGSMILAQFGSRSGVMLSILKEKIKNYIREKQFSVQK